jgi:hypothetical protein
MYTALVLDDASRTLLLQHVAVPDGWQKVAHHMTVNMGEATQGPANHLVGKVFTLRADYIASDDRVIAVAVETKVPSKNEKKHITVAVNRDGGGKPVHSNQLTEWKKLPQTIELKGTVKVVI